VHVVYVIQVVCVTDACVCARPAYVMMVVIMIVVIVMIVMIVMRRFCQEACAVSPSYTGLD